MRVFISDKCIDWKDVNRKNLFNITQFLQFSHQIHYLSPEFFSETLFWKILIVSHGFYFVLLVLEKIGHSLPKWQLQFGRH